LQFLDGTVAFAAIAVARSAHMFFRLKRTYVFDYTATSIERRQGFVVLLGNDVETVGYASDETAARAPPSGRSQPSEPTQITHLQQWKGRVRDESGQDTETPD